MFLYLVTGSDISNMCNLCYVCGISLSVKMSKRPHYCTYSKASNTYKASLLILIYIYNTLYNCFNHVGHFIGNNSKTIFYMLLFANSYIRTRFRDWFTRLGICLRVKPRPTLEFISPISISSSKGKAGVFKGIS